MTKNAFIELEWWFIALPVFSQLFYVHEKIQIPVRIHVSPLCKLIACLGLVTIISVTILFQFLIYDPKLFTKPDISLIECLLKSNFNLPSNEDVGRTIMNSRTFVMRRCVSLNLVNGKNLAYCPNSKSMFSGCSSDQKKYARTGRSRKGRETDGTVYLYKAN